MSDLSLELEQLDSQAMKKAEALATSSKWIKLTPGAKKLLAMLVDSGQYVDIEDAAFQMRTSTQWIHRHAMKLSELGLARRELSVKQIWLNG